MNSKIHMQVVMCLLLSMCSVNCAAHNKIDLIQGTDIGFAPENPPPKDCIWFTQKGWDEMGTAQINVIKKKVSP